MDSDQNSKGFSASPISPEYRAWAEVEKAVGEGPRAFMDRMDQEKAEGIGQEIEAAKNRVREMTVEELQRFVSKGDGLTPALMDFARDVAARRLGEKGTTHKGYGFRIDTEGRVPLRR